MLDLLTNAMTLTRASVSDIPNLVRIHLAAFAYDSAARLILRNKDNHKGKLQSMLESEMSNPKGSLIKAISKEPRDILGWLGFGLVGYPDLDEERAIPEIEHAMPTVKISEKTICAWRSKKT